MAGEELVFIDVEASGLHRGSYPIEVGWCGLDLQANSFLIKPAADWTEREWSGQAERIHGIARSTCVRDGIDVWDAARRLNTVLSDKVILSDAPEFDAKWLLRLFNACGVEPTFDLRPIDAIRPIKAGWDAAWLSDQDRENVQRRVKERWPRSHRAAQDAAYLAALYRAATEPHFWEQVAGKEPGVQRSGFG